MTEETCRCCWFGTDSILTVSVSAHTKKVSRARESSCYLLAERAENEGESSVYVCAGCETTSLRQTACFEWVSEFVSWAEAACYYCCSMNLFHSKIYTKPATTTIAFACYSLSPQKFYSFIITTTTTIIILLSLTSFPLKSVFSYVWAEKVRERDVLHIVPLWNLISRHRSYGQKASKPKRGPLRKNLHKKLVTRSQSHFS